MNTYAPELARWLAVARELDAKSKYVYDIGETAADERMDLRELLGSTKVHCQRLEVVASSALLRGALDTATLVDGLGEELVNNEIAEDAGRYTVTVSVTVVVRHSGQS